MVMMMVVIMMVIVVMMMVVIMMLIVMMIIALIAMMYKNCFRMLLFPVLTQSLYIVSLNLIEIFNQTERQSDNK